MKYIIRILAVLLFIVFFGFALKNTQEAALEFFWGYEIRGALVLLLLGFFVAGAVLGIAAMLPTLYRYRRDLSKEKKRAAALEKAQAQHDASTAPLPDSIAIK